MGILQFFRNRQKQKELIEPKLEKHIDYKDMVLMYKDTPVIDVKFGEHGISECGNLRDIEMLPRFVINPNNPQTVDNINYKEMKMSIWDWIQYRTIPDARPNLTECLKRCGLKTPTDLMCHSLGLSFSDSYWFKPKGLEITWDDVNLYKNGFSRDVGDILMDPTTNKLHISFLSPDPTTKGIEPKRWVIENGEAYLIKTDKQNEQKAYNELVAALICKKLGLRCAEYETIKGKMTTDMYGAPTEFKCTFSKSKNFCREGINYYPADQVRMMMPTSDLNDFLETLKVKEPAVFKEFQKMIVLDFIINNEDRHSENFGFEIDENGNWYLAPVFDNGNSLYYNKGIQAIGKDEYTGYCKFHGGYDNPVMMWKNIEYKDQLDFFNIEDFANIKEEVIEIFRESSMSEERIQALADYVESQIQEVQKFKDRLPERIIIKDEIDNEER